MGSMSRCFNKKNPIYLPEDKIWDYIFYLLNNGGGDICNQGLYLITTGYL